MFGLLSGKSSLFHIGMVSTLIALQSHWITDWKSFIGSITMNMKRVNILIDNLGLGNYTNLSLQDFNLAYLWKPSFSNWRITVTWKSQSSFISIFSQVETVTRMQKYPNWNRYMQLFNVSWTMSWSQHIW